MRHILYILFLAALIPGCGRGDLTTGSMVTREGRITDMSTTYNFTNVRKDGTVKRLFNDIYFAGDMVCFSIGGIKDVDPKDIKAVYTHAPTGKSMEAERIEITGSRLWGFSLVGSLLECFFNQDLDGNAGEWEGKGADIPVTVTVSIPAGDGTGTIRRDFTIRVVY